MPDDPAIAIYFHLDAELMALAINSFASIEQNIAAAAATLEAYRKLDRYGVSLAQGDLIIRLRLPEKATASNTWWSVLGVPINAGSEQIKSAYRKLVKTHHPDTGGDRAAWDRVQSAYKQAMQTVSQ
ncbi:MAG: J domain-containing protein [Cyanobacteria bacterium P01_C01_bin.120]